MARNWNAEIFLLEEVQPGELFRQCNTGFITRTRHMGEEVLFKRYIYPITRTEAIRKHIAYMELPPHRNIVLFRGVVVESDRCRNNLLQMTMDPNSGVDGDVSFYGILMERMEGGPLSSVIHDKRRNEENVEVHVVDYSRGEAVDWAIQACEGLEHIHAHGVLHRDMKPANLFLSADRKTLKIGGFGLAREEREMMTNSVGTDGYMAPEVMDGYEGVTEYDRTCDVYSMAITLWEMIHRRIPYDELQNMSRFERENAIIMGRRPSFVVIHPSDQILMLVVASCWEHVPAEERAVLPFVRKPISWMRDMLLMLLNWVA